ncbi:MAG: ABC transporter permease [Chthoniobacterales bacterium]|nr:ABC transporter permease [Chthoniobacterales bacterium]
MLEPGAATRILRRPTAKICLGILIFVVLAAAVGPELFPESYREPGPWQYSPPTWQHPFGTDLNGRDVLYRVLLGARISLVVGLAGAAMSLFLGTAYGLVAGYAGGKTDNAMMRLVDIMYSVPRLIFILIFINAFDGHVREFASRMDWSWLVSYSRIVILIITLGLIEWLTMARIVRGQVLALKERSFIHAARVLGQSHTKIVTRHLLPNIMPIVIVYLTLTVPAVILDESFLSFLGLGIQPPQASWGSLLAEGAQSINPLKIYWWLLLFPAATMSATLLALNYLGDRLRDSLDPRR